MAIHVAVVDDDQAVHSRISDFLKRYGEEKGVNWNISFFKAGTEFLFQYQAKYDVIMLDIEMPVLNGLDVARRIRKVDGDVTIVFITNMANYAVQGYEVDALDYIVKPFSYEVFRFRIDRIVSRIEKNKKDTPILLNSSDQVYRIHTGDLLYVEVYHHSLVYHTSKGEITVRGSMKEAEALLIPVGFCKCSQSCLINLRFVTKIGKDSVYLKDREIHISRGSKKELIRALAELTTVV